MYDCYVSARFQRCGEEVFARFQLHEDQVLARARYSEEAQVVFVNLYLSDTNIIRL